MSDGDLDRALEIRSLGTVTTHGVSKVLQDTRKIILVAVQDDIYVLSLGAFMSCLLHKVLMCSFIKYTIN